MPTELKNSVIRGAKGSTWLTRRGLVIELSPPNIVRLREKRCKKWYTTTLDGIYMMLVKQEAEERAEQKRKDKADKAKRKPTPKVKRGMLKR